MLVLSIQADSEVSCNLHVAFLIHWDPCDQSMSSRFGPCLPVYKAPTFQGLEKLGLCFMFKLRTFAFSHFLLHRARIPKPDRASGFFEPPV